MLTPQYRTPRFKPGIIIAAVVVILAARLPAQAIPIAVLDFEANGISQTEVIALTDRLRNELFRLGEPRGISLPEAGDHHESSTCVFRSGGCT